MTSPLVFPLAVALAYFAAGAFREYLVIHYYRQIAKKNRLAVAGLAGGIEVWDLLVLASIISTGWSPLLIGAYTLGVMLGTYLGVGKK